MINELGRNPTYEESSTCYVSVIEYRFRDTRKVNHGDLLRFVMRESFTTLPRRVVTNNFGHASFALLYIIT